MTAKFPKKVKELFKPKRFKVLYGGRGSGKSYSAVQYLVLKAVSGTELILCAREFQNSIRDSVYSLIKEVIYSLELEAIFKITRDEIICTLTGSKFLFKGLHNNIESLKSTYGITIAFIEEAQTISQNSLDILVPTIREEGSEIIFVFNPHLVDDPIYQMFLSGEREDSLLIQMNYEDNPYLPEVLKDQIEYDRAQDPERYSWIWEGNVRTISEAQIFTGSYSIREFETSKEAQYLVGADWGFAKDPTTFIRGFLKDNILYLDKEVHAFGATYEELPKLLDSILPSKRWPITGDSSRPDTIDYLNRKGYNIKGAKKGPGSIIDGIERLRGFTNIIIHPTLKHTIEEFRLYSYKQNKHTGEILPVPEDRNNHLIDSLRYCTEGINPKAHFISWEDL